MTLLAVEMVFGASLSVAETQLLCALDDVGQKCDHRLLNRLSSNGELICPHLVATGATFLFHFYQKREKDGLHPTITGH